ncbi:MAG: DUF72 domain-containing protein [Candidatus Aminicenantales bacterium]|jgi:uncharacterized protein YecE (DUF72 family)
MKRVWVGTAGWSYDDWAGIVYPEPRGAGFHPLPFLARSIDLVEINSTFYRPATEAMALSWVRKVEPFPDFLFAVKVHQSFTHDRGRSGGAEAAAFLRTIGPLIAARRLAALLLQFPWSFIRTPDNEAYLKALFRLFSGQPLALEIRHSSWNERSFFELLKEHRVAFCNIDQPVIGKSIGPTAVSTRPDFSYVRLHGRNAQNWFREGAGRDARYDYLYAKDELGEWVHRIKDLAASSDRIYVITNNHYRGQALANALQIKNMVSGEKLEVPAGLLKQYPLLEEIVKKIRAGQFRLFDEDDGGPGSAGSR